MPKAIQSLLATLWQKNTPKILANIALLETAANSQTLTPELRSEATTAAHNLAGSLGMYGYPKGTEAARTLEQELREPHPNLQTLLALVEALKQSLPAPGE